VRIATVATGLDPTIGYLHACRPDRRALVYDLMEPLRPQVDRFMLDLARSRTFAPSDFILTSGGVCRLHPQLARTMAGMAMGENTMRDVVVRMVTELNASAAYWRSWHSTCTVLTAHPVLAGPGAATINVTEMGHLALYGCLFNLASMHGQVQTHELYQPISITDHR